MKTLNNITTPRRSDLQSARSSITRKDGFIKSMGMSKEKKKSFQQALMLDKLKIAGLLETGFPWDAALLGAHSPHTPLA